jgi:serine/threonine protein kinase
MVAASHALFRSNRIMSKVRGASMPPLLTYIRRSGPLHQLQSEPQPPFAGSRSINLHQRGIIHKDIKPVNILVDPGLTYSIVRNAEYNKMRSKLRRSTLGADSRGIYSAFY